MPKKKRILITGASGFLGYSLGQHFCAVGHEVLGVARHPVPACFPMDHGSLSPDEIARAVERFQPDVLLHAAGAASVGKSIADPSRDFGDSVTLVHQVLEGVRRTALRPRFVFPSSAAVYGEAERLPIDETAPLRPISPYGFHKKMCEEIVQEYARCFALPGLIVRLFSLFGPLQRRLLVWEIFEKYMREDEVVLQGTGSESRDYLHIDDMAEALLRLLDAPLDMCRTVNVASGEEITVRSLVQTMGRLLGSRKTVRFRNAPRAADPNRWRAEVSLFAQLTGHRIVADPDSRLMQTMDRWRENFDGAASTRRAHWAEKG